MKKITSGGKIIIALLAVLIVSIWAVFAINSWIKYSIYLKGNTPAAIPCLEMDQVMADVDEIFTPAQAEVLHYIYEECGAATITVNPYNTEEWYVRFVVGSYSNGECAGIAYSYNRGKWEYWDYGWPAEINPADYPMAVG